jgi:hypothetical protein
MSLVETTRTRDALAPPSRYVVASECGLAFAGLRGFILPSPHLRQIGRLGSVSRRIDSLRQRWPRNTVVNAGEFDPNAAC